MTSGQPARPALVVTADDFGLALEVNEAVERAHQNGILNAASLMVAGAASRDAVRRAKRNPGLRTGLHIVLVDGRPASKASDIPHLLDDSGRLRLDLARLGFEIAFRPDVARQIETEIRAQFELYRATGLPLDHANAHKHFHLHPVVGSAIIRIGASYGLRAIRIPSESRRALAKAEPTPLSGREFLLTPWLRVLRRQARRASLLTPDAVFGMRWSGAMTPERLAALIALAPAGVVEIYTHPGVANDFPGHCPGYDYAGEFAALCDRRVAAAVAARFQSTCGFSDISVDHSG